MRTAVFVSLLTVLAAGSPAGAGPYTFTTLTPPAQNGAFPNATAYAINNAGSVAVVVNDATFQFSQSFLYSGGTYSPLTGPPDAGANFTLVDTLNNTGGYGGNYFSNNSGSVHGFVFSGGKFQAIDAPGGINTLVTGVNDNGLVIGTAGSNAGAGLVSFSYLNGQYTPLADPNGPTTTDVNGVNNAGAIVGNYQDANHQNHGFLLQNGQYTPLDDPAGANGLGSFPLAINNNGEIVGFYTDASGNTHGYVYQNGVFTTVDDPLGVGGTNLYGVNDLGQLVGSYTDASGISHAFVASPAVPEPASLTLLAVAGAALAVRRLRRP